LGIIDLATAPFVSHREFIPAGPLVGNVDSEGYELQKLIAKKGLRRQRVEIGLSIEFKPGVSKRAELRRSICSR
jgi:hypothetical protein